jgi:hypothetical protein
MAKLNDVMKTINNRNIFLIDGVGALLSAGLLLVLFQYESVFGMPKAVLKNLIPIGCVFAVYSLSCFVLRPNRWKLLLMIIALANLLYCVITVAAVIQHSDSLTLFGRIYFLLELLVILVLVAAEWRVAGRSP